MNEADSSEPGGISPQRRKKLIKDAENRIASLADFFKPGDIIIDYFEERRAALLRGASADEIDALTEDYAEQNGIELDVFDQDWVGTERLKLKQISRIEDEDERDAALEALATESILKEDQQKALRPARVFTEEWFTAQQSRWPNWKWRLKHPLRSLLKFAECESISLSWWQSIIRFLFAYLLYMLVMALVAVIIIIVSYLTGLSYSWVMLIAWVFFFYLIWRSEKKRKK